MTRRMTSIQLNEKLLNFKIKQLDLARILDVTPRTVNLWCTGARLVPGYVEAYFRLFEHVPNDIKWKEVIA